MDTVQTSRVSRWATTRSVARDPLIARLLRSHFAFSITERGCWMAVLLFAFERGGVAEAGWLVVFLLAPSALLAPVLAYASDVLPRQRVLTYGYGTLAAVTIGTGVAMVLDAPITVVYALALAFSVLLTFGGPAAAAIIPIAVTTPDDLTAANTASGVVETAGRMLGPMLAGIILIRSPPGVVMITIGALMGAGAVATIGLRTTAIADAGPHLDDPAPQSVLVEVTAGLRMLRADAQIRTLVGGVATASWIAGAVDVGAAQIAIDVLGRDDASVSILITGFGVGGMVGSALSFALVGRRNLARALAASVVSMCVALGLVGWSGHLVSATLLIVMVGAGVTLTSITGRTMLQGLAPSDTLARLFGVLEASRMAGLAFGGVALSFLAVRTTSTAAFAVVGGVGIIGLAVMWRRLVSIDRARRVVDRELLELARSTAIFGALPPYAIEQVLYGLVEETLEPRSTLIAADDVGERLCLVASGSVDVHRDGRIIATHRRGAVVGEIAVLRGVPRTATVTAGASGACVYWMGSGAFLDAVNRVPRSRARAEAEATRRLGP